MTLPENSVLFINIGIVLLLVISFIIGYTKGVLLQVFKTLGILIVALFSWIIAPGLSELIQIFPEKWAPFHDTELAPLFYDKINALCWFVIVFVIGLLIIESVKPIFKAVTEIPVLKQFNQLAGALFSLIPSFIIIVLATFLLNTALFTNGKDVVNDSLLQYTSVVTDKVVGVLSNSFKENVAIQKMISDPLSLETDDLREVIDWLKRSKVSSQEIYDFLKNYGIDTKKLNELIKDIED